MASGTKVLTPLDSDKYFETVPTSEPIPEEGPPIRWSVVPFPGRGQGLQVHQAVPCGQTIVREKAAVIGPKQTSPLVCVECFKMFPGQRVVSYIFSPSLALISTFAHRWRG